MSKPTISRAAMDDVNERLSHAWRCICAVSDPEVGDALDELLGAVEAILEALEVDPDDAE